MSGGHNADPHHGGNYRNLIFFRKLLKFFLRMTQQNTAAGADDRALCLLKFLDHFLDLCHVPFYSRLIGSHIDFFRILEFPHRAVLDINGNVY